MKDRNKPLYKPEYSEALARVSVALLGTGRTTTVPVSKAGGLISAASVRAPGDFPASQVARMDGHALGLVAGNRRDMIVRTGEPVPAWVAKVVPHELYGSSPTYRWDDNLTDRPNIVRQGAEFRAGEELLAAGRIVRPADVAALELLGVEQVTVYRPLDLVVVVCGSNPEGRAAGGWLAEMLVPIRRVRLTMEHANGLEDCAQLVQGHDFAALVSDAAPGRYEQFKDLGRRGKVAGYVPDFWKMNLYPCKHVGFGQLESVPTLLMPDVPSKTILASLALLVPGLVAASSSRGFELPCEWRGVENLPEPFPRIVAVRVDSDGQRLAASPLHRESPISGRVIARADGYAILSGPVKDGRIAPIFPLPGGCYGR